MYWNNQGSIIYKGKLYNRIFIDKCIDLVRTYIVKKKIQKSAVVAIFMDRGVWPLIIMFALLQEEIPFLPIDVTLPRKRWGYMLEHLHVTFVIADDKYKQLFENKKVITVHDFQQMSEIRENIIVEYNHDEKTRNFYEDIAYYLYTSGSTGTPKAVEVTQRGLKNFITAIPQRIPLHKSQRIACTTMMSFDIFFLESILALQLGMQIVLLSEEERLNPKRMGNLFLEYDVDVVQLTPSHLNMVRLVDEDFSGFQNVRCLLIGGEAFPQNLLKELQQKTKCRIFNMYGPTETTIWSSVAELTNESEVHIGTPILNTQFYILDEHQCPVKEGECGELCISGAGLSNGYKFEQALTQEKFIEAPFEQGLRLFRTGDLVKYNNDKFYCLGRSDNQVKYRGHRVELEEIEGCCNKIHNVFRCIAYLQKDENEEYLVMLYEGKASVEEIKKEMILYLPTYMIPTGFCKVEKLFCTPNGKIDRKRNMEVYLWDLRRCHSESSLESYTHDEKVLQILKKTCMPIEIELSPETPLSSLNMDSLSFVSLIVELEEGFQIHFQDEMLSMDKFETINEIITYTKTLSEARENGM